MVRHNNPETICEDIAMRSHQLTLSSSMTSHRAIGFLLSAVVLAGFSHKPNILDAFGEDWFASKEGEASVFKPDGSNNLVLVARVQAADWIRAGGGQ
jgi:hypothetical protein